MSAEAFTAELLGPRGLEHFRELAEARMLDEFDIAMPTGLQYDDDPASPTYGEEVEAHDTLFTTPGRIKVIGAYGVQREVGGRTAFESVRELHIPVSAAKVPAGAVAIVRSIHETTDANVEVGDVLSLEVTPGSQTTARRMTIREVTS